MNVLIDKFKEVSLSVIPITLLVIFGHMTVSPLPTDVILRFIIGAFCIIVGLGIFLFGAELGISSIGNLVGRSAVQKNSKLWVVFICVIVGFFITFAEPSVNVLAAQVTVASSGALQSFSVVAAISLAVGLMISVSVYRVLYSKSIRNTFLIFYTIVFVLSIVISEEIFTIAMDSGGASTGAMTTPFILALGYGVSQFRGGKKRDADAFGHTGLASIGPMIAVMLLALANGVKGIDGIADPFVPAVGVWGPYLNALVPTFKESLLTVGPLTILFIIMNEFVFKLPRKKMFRILKGLIYTFIGLFLFFLGVNTGFMDAGRLLGGSLAVLEKSWILPAFGFVLGMVVVLAEPAVYVLTQQIEEVTSGHIQRRIILIFLSIGIALAVMLSMLRIILPWLQLWHILLPGYAIGMLLSRRVSELFVGIGFDSGSVASGPMTATFVFAFAQGAAEAMPHANVLLDGFGVIAMIAMMPVVALQILGYIYSKKDKESERIDHEYTT